MFLLPGLMGQIAALLLGLLCILCVHLLFSSLNLPPPWHLSRPLRALRHITLHGDVLLAPRKVTQACLPFTPTSQPRLQFGAILWASAATVTHTLAEPCDRDAILATVKPLGFTPEKFLARCPILGEVEANGQKGYVVRDGNGFRAYFLGEPAALLQACTHVWEQQERPLAEDDPARLPASRPGLYGLAMAPADDDGVGPLTYLGSLLVETPLQHTDAPQRLSSGGFQVTVLPADHAPEHTEALTALSTAQDIPHHTLHVALEASGDNSYTVPDPNIDWVEDILAMQRRSMHHTIEMYGALCAPLCLALAAMVWQLPAWLIPLGMVLTLPRSLDFLCLGQKTRALPGSIIRLCICVMLCLAGGMGLYHFSGYVSPQDAHAGLVIAFCAMATLLSLGQSGLALKLVLPLGVAGIAAAWLILQVPVLLGAFCLLAGLLLALVLRLLLRPLECS